MYNTAGQGSFRTLPYIHQGQPNQKGQSRTLPYITQPQGGQNSQSGSSPGGVFYPTTPNVNIQTTPKTPYTSKYGSGTQMGSLINTFGGMLSGMGQFSKDLPYQTFADPFRQTLSQWEQQFARPEYETRTLNPFKRDWASQAAAGGLQHLGGGAKRFGEQRNVMESGYQDKIAQAQNQLEEMVRRMYEGRMSQHYLSPTAFRS